MRIGRAEEDGGDRRRWWRKKGRSGKECRSRNDREMMNRSLALRLLLLLSMYDAGQLGRDRPRGPQDHPSNLQAPYSKTDGLLARCVWSTGTLLSSSETAGSYSANMLRSDMTGLRHLDQNQAQGRPCRVGRGNAQPTPQARSQRERKRQFIRPADSAKLYRAVCQLYRKL